MGAQGLVALFIGAPPVALDPGALARPLTGLARWAHPADQRRGAPTVAAEPVRCPSKGGRAATESGEAVNGQRRDQRRRERGLSVAGGTLDGMNLTVRDHMTIAGEAHWWKYAGAKDAYIRETFSETPTAYYARLNRLLDDPAAEAAYPVLVRRLRRLRDSRRQGRRESRSPDRRAG